MTVGRLCFNCRLPCVMSYRTKHDPLAAGIIVDCCGFFARILLACCHSGNSHAVIAEPHVVVERDVQHSQCCVRLDLNCFRPLQYDRIKMSRANGARIGVQFAFHCDPWLTLKEPDVLCKRRLAELAAADCVLMCCRTECGW